MLQIDFLHATFLVKKTKIVRFNKIQSWFLYSILVKKANFFFILVLQRFSSTLTKVVKSKVSFIFKFKIPSKIIFNLILMETVNSFNCLSSLKSFHFSSFCRRRTKYSLLRSPFVFKKSQEQLLFDLYTGSFLLSFAKNNVLFSEYSEFFIIKSLKKHYLLGITVFKYLKTVGVC